MGYYRLRKYFTQLHSSKQVVYCLRMVYTVHKASPCSGDCFFADTVYTFFKAMSSFCASFQICSFIVYAIKSRSNYTQVYRVRPNRRKISSVFPTAKNLVSWACCCPRNDQSNGKVKSTRISRARSYLKPLLVQVANAVVKSDKYPECKERYRRIKAHRSHKKAIIAICKMLLTAIWNILSIGLYE